MLDTHLVGDHPSPAGNVTTVVDFTATTFLTASGLLTLDFVVQARLVGRLRGFRLVPVMPGKRPALAAFIVAVVFLLRKLSALLLQKVILSLQLLLLKGPVFPLQVVVIPFQDVLLQFACVSLLKLRHYSPCPLSRLVETLVVITTTTVLASLAFSLASPQATLGIPIRRGNIFVLYDIDRITSRKQEQSIDKEQGLDSSKQYGVLYKKLVGGAYLGWYPDAPRL